MIFIFEEYRRKVHLYLHNHRKFIVIGLETNEKMDPDELYPQNAISYYISSY